MRRCGPRPWRCHCSRPPVSFGGSVRCGPWPPGGGFFCRVCWSRFFSFIALGLELLFEALDRVGGGVARQPIHFGRVCQANSVGPASRYLFPVSFSAKGSMTVWRLPLLRRASSTPCSCRNAIRAGWPEFGWRVSGRQRSGSSFIFNQGRARARAYLFDYVIVIVTVIEAYPLAMPRQCPGIASGGGLWRTVFRGKHH